MIIARAFNALPATARGAIWMVLGGISLILLAIVIRDIQDKYHVLQMIFLRSIISFLIILPWALRQKREDLQTKRLPLHIFRNSIHYLGNVGWFIGVTLVTLADLQALQFTVPLFTIVMATIFLKEHVGAHRWIATGLGFLGALVIIRPGICRAEHRHNRGSLLSHLLRRLANLHESRCRIPTHRTRSCFICH